MRVEWWLLVDPFRAHQSWTWTHTCMSDPLWGSACSRSCSQILIRIRLRHACIRSRVLASTVSCSLSVVAPFERWTHTPHPRHKINLISWMRATLSSPRAAQGCTPTNDPRGTAFADGYAGSPAPSANVPAGGGVSSVEQRRVQVQPPTYEEIRVMPNFLSPPASQLDHRAGCGDPPGIQRQIGTESGNLATPLQMTSFDEVFRIRYANTQARVIAVGAVAEPRRQEGQTASQGFYVRGSGPSEVEVLRQTVARLEQSILLQRAQQQHHLHPAVPAVILPPWMGPGSQLWGLWLYAVYRVWWAFSRSPIRLQRIWIFWSSRD